MNMTNSRQDDKNIKAVPEPQALEPETPEASDKATDHKADDHRKQLTKIPIEKKSPLIFLKSVHFEVSKFDAKIERFLAPQNLKTRVTQLSLAQNSPSNHSEVSTYSLFLLRQTGHFRYKRC